MSENTNNFTICPENQKEIETLLLTPEGRKKISLELKRKMEVVLADMEPKFLEREELIRLLFLAIFSRHHVFLIGLPGVGKTYLVEALRDVFQDSRYWSLLLDKETSRDQLFGKLAYEGTKTIFEEEDTVLGSEFIFLDEMFKASSELLNSLLQIMADRVYSVKGKHKAVPLNTLFGASNELPEGKLIAPFKDRLLIWFDVPRLQKDSSFKKLISRQFDSTRNFREKFWLEEIRLSTLISKHVIVSEEILDIYTLIKNNMDRACIQISDRKLLWIMDVLTTSAVLNGRDEVNVSDLFLLPNMTWHTEIEKKNSRKIVHEVLFGNENTINKAVIEVEANLNRKKANYNINFKRLFDYLEDFTGLTAEKRFNEIYNNIRNGRNGIQEIVNDSSTLVQLYEFSINIEKLVTENIMVPDYKCLVFSNKTVELIQQHKIVSSNILEEFDVFLNEVDSLSEYRSRRGERRMRKTA